MHIASSEISAGWPTSSFLEVGGGDDIPLHAHATIDATGFIVEITEYEFVNDRDAAGNVRRVKKKAPPGPSLDPRTFNVFVTEFDYDRAGEVQAIVQRTWTESSVSVL